MTFLSLFFGGSSKSHILTSYTILRNNSACILNDMGKKITISRIAGLLDCSTRTIHRNMCTELKREKELLNQQL